LCFCGFSAVNNHVNLLNTTKLLLDLRANAEYIRMADHYMPVEGGSNNNNYANVDVIVDLAERAGAQAVWAGWGHASEYPALPRRLAAAGIVFIGPPAKAMHDLGDKIASTLVAQSAGVPCVPWSGAGIRVAYAENGVDDASFRASCVETLDEARRAIAQHGIAYPIMLKASEGGGGKGIRRCESDEALGAALRQVFFFLLPMIFLTTTMIVFWQIIMLCNYNIELGSIRSSRFTYIYHAIGCQCSSFGSSSELFISLFAFFFFF
jgi:biotin carboxylase